MSEDTAYATYGFDFRNEEALKLAVEYLNFRFSDFYDKNGELLQAVCNGIKNEGVSNSFGNFISEGMAVKIGGDYWPDNDDGYYEDIAKSMMKFIIANGQKTFKCYVYVEFYGEYNSYTCQKVYEVEDGVLVSEDEVDCDDCEYELQEAIPDFDFENEYVKPYYARTSFISSLYCDEENFIEILRKYLHKYKDDCVASKENYEAFEAKLNNLKEDFAAGKLSDYKKYESGSEIVLKGEK